MKIKRLLFPLMIIILAVLFTGCASYTPVNQAAPAAGANTVVIENFAFTPAAITVKKGDTVTWVNRDSAPHTATGAAFDSKGLARGQSFSFTFNEAGTFDYICTYHPSMKGQVIVK
ncbi:MAG: cupredoxin family copper-binding protein [Syntrophomonas sp.]